MFFLGQTLQRVLVDTAIPSFSHGHTYVAISRTPRREAFHLWCKPDNGAPKPVITNVVYEDLLLPENISRVWDLANVGPDTECVIAEEGYASMDDDM